MKLKNEELLKMATTDAEKIEIKKNINVHTKTGKIVDGHDRVLKSLATELKSIVNTYDKMALLHIYK